jgi:hypothetical protein
MTTATASVIAVLGVDTGLFTKGMQTAANATKSASAQMNAAMASLNKPFRAVVGFVDEVATAVGGPLTGAVMGMTKNANALGVALGTLTVGFGYLARNSLRAADDLGDTASSLGITTDRLQELYYSAMLGGVSTEGMTNAMNQLTKRLGEAHDGGGPLVEFLKDYDRTLLAALQNTKDASEAFDVLTGAVERETDATKRRQLVSAAFGKGEINLINLLRQGSDAIRQQAEEAHRLGLVIDEAMIQKSGEAADKLDILGRVLSTKVTASMVELAPVIDTLGTKLISITEKVFKFIGAFAGINELTGKQASEQLKLVTGQIEAINTKLADGERSMADRVAVPDSWLEERREQLRAQRDELIEVVKQQEKLAASTKKAETAVTGRKASSLPYIKSESEAAAKRAGDAAKKAADEAERLAAIYERADNAAAAFSYENDESVRSMERMRKAADDAGDAIANSFQQAMRNGASLSDTLKGLAIDLLNLAYKATIGDAISSSISRAASGIFGSIFGGASSAAGTFFGAGDALVPRGSASITWAGARADGGPVTAGQSYMVGERGPERFTPSSNGYISPHGSGGGTTIGTLNIDARGAQAGVSEEIVAAIRSLDQSLESRAVKAVVQSRQRNPNLFN